MAHILSGKVAPGAASRLAQPRLWTTRSGWCGHRTPLATMLICWRLLGIHKVQLCFSLPSVWGKGRKSKASSIDQIRSLKTPCKGAPSRSGGCQAANDPWRLKRCPEAQQTQPHYWKGSGPRLRVCTFIKSGPLRIIRGYFWQKQATSHQQFHTERYQPTIFCF